MPFTLTPLPYSNNALEPYVDARTMEIHHDKHHAAYTNNLNAAIKDTDWESKSIEAILANAGTISPAVRNNGGGFYNHNLFWEVMCPHGANDFDRSLEVAQAIENQLGGFEKWKADFKQTAVTRFGSGWAWLYVKPDGTLALSSTPNQDNPLMDIAEHKGTPVLGCDVWEHAYYLLYQNRRPDYVEGWFHIINWRAVNDRYLMAKK